MANSNRATHDGECQLCGRHQKLPGGRMAKHGYTKRWGMFEGTCPGSDHLPYELSADQIPPRITQVLLSITRLQEQIENLRAPATSPSIEWRVYDRNRSAYVTAPAEAAELPDGRFTIRFRDARYGSSNPYMNLYDEMSKVKSVLDLATAVNRRKAKGLLPHLQELREYATWLQDRHSSWKLQALKPRKD